MRTMLWILDSVGRRRLARHTRQYLSGLATSSTRGWQNRMTTLLQTLDGDPGPRLLLGETEWGERVALPLEFVVKAHSIVTGGTGSGKSMAALLLVEAMLEAADAGLPRFAFGILDAKGELFERVLYLLARRIRKLDDEGKEKLLKRIEIIDLTRHDPVTSYNIARPWAGSDQDFFTHSRTETLQELLPGGDAISLRGCSVVRHVLKLLAAAMLPFAYFDRVLCSEAIREKLVTNCGNEELRYYFRYHFPREPKATIEAVRARLLSALMSSSSLKLALSGQDVPDFRRLQDEGRIVLINCAGPNIPRTTARTLQALFLSDIRQAVFCRQNMDVPYLWVCDEAQNFFRTRQLRENMVDLLTMSRSFGAFFLYLTQNLASAVQDGAMLETLFTNIRWSLSLRTTAQDASFLRGALPVTGRRRKPSPDPFAPPEYSSPAEERSLLLEGMACLPDREGWLWLKALTGEAVKIKTTTLQLPPVDEFREEVEQIRANPDIGSRMTRTEFLRKVAKRDRKWTAGEGADKVTSLKKAYQEERKCSE